MPKVLIVAATKNEILPLLKHFGKEDIDDDGLFQLNDGLSLLITGVGMVNTAYFMGRYSDKEYDHVMNVGICGSFDRNLAIGSLVNIIEDCISEMGAENGEDFIKYNEMGLGGSNKYRNRINQPIPAVENLVKVAAITVNKVHGNIESIGKTLKHYNIQTESMEGAAFFRGCSIRNKNFYQIRAISNYVELRDRSKWNIPLAIENLNAFILKLINTL